MNAHLVKCNQGKNWRAIFNWKIYIHPVYLEILPLRARLLLSPSLSHTLSHCVPVRKRVLMYDFVISMRKFHFDANECLLLLIKPSATDDLA